MLDLLAGFIPELRKAGLPVTLTENLDAMEAVQHIPLEDREAFKYALGRHAGEEQRPLARVRDGVRGLLLPARAGVHASVDGDGRRRSTSCGARCRSSMAGRGPAAAPAARWSR